MQTLKTFSIKTLLFCGFAILSGYTIFRLWFIAFPPFFAIFSLLIVIAEGHNALQFFTSLYSLWPRKYQQFNSAYKNKAISINIFICVCGEPVDIVRPTILAAKKAVSSYYQQVHPNRIPQIYVLNDGFSAKKSNWKEIENLTFELEVKHFIRNSTKGHKAGNINNALRLTPVKNSHNTLDIVLDADFAMLPEFLVEIIRPFGDTSVDFTQTPQAYKNSDSWVARAATAHQKYFFSHICPAKANDNALFLCGTNFAIRRSALLSTGGMDERFITEDYATSLKLHLQGKKGVFINKPLAYGIGPSSLNDYFTQQQRWSKGTFDTSLAYWKQILFGTLTIRQKFQYLASSLYYLSGIRNLIFMLAPLFYLFFGVYLTNVNNFNYFLYLYLPFFVYNFLLYYVLFDNPLESWILDTITFPIYISSFIASVLKKQTGFNVTLKKFQKENVFQVYSVQMLAIFTLVAGFISGVYLHHLIYNAGEAMIYFWVLFNLAILTFGFYLFLKDNYKANMDSVTLKLFHVESAKAISLFEKVLVIPAVICIALFSILNNQPLLNTLGSIVPSTQIQAQTEMPKELLVPSTGVYYGYYLPNLSQHPQTPTTSILPNEKTSLAMYYQDWGQNESFDIKFMDSLYNQNVIPILTWEPWNAATGDKGKISQPEYSPRLIAEGKYDDYIHSFAHEVALFKKPFFLRFAHEMNGNWYSWSNIDNNTPGDYVAMWKHVHNIFADEGATNAIWIWSPNNIDEKGSTDSIHSYYPGDAYVDWVAYSGFNWGNSTIVGWKSFAQISASIYPILLQLDKPIMVAETSSVSSANPLDKIEWFENLANTLPTLPNIKAIVFYNDNYKGSNFKILSGMDTKETFNKNVVNNPYFIKIPLFNQNSQLSSQNHPVAVSF